MNTEVWEKSIKQGLSVNENMRKDISGEDISKRIEKCSMAAISDSNSATKHDSACDSSHEIAARIDCFARDVMVSVVYGEDRRIDELNPGDRVLASDGRPLTFLYNVTGMEAKLLRITAENGSIRVTGNHPMMLADGTIRVAELIKPGDSLLTNRGSCQVLKCQEEDYSDQVYNPMFDGNDDGGTFIFANGFCCGDYCTQNSQTPRKQELSSEEQDKLIAEFKAIEEDLRRRCNG